jgi:phosphoserine aminotransferase
VDEQLKALMNIPSDYAIFFAGSGSELWERTILNSSKEFTHHFVNGYFSNRFKLYASALGRTVSSTDVSYGTSFDMRALEVPEQAELIALTHNETSTGAKIPLGMISSLRSKFPSKVIAVDIVSSAPFVDFDFQEVDMAFFSVQKAFGLPAGLGVWVVHPRMLSIQQSIGASQSVGAHHTLTSFFSNYTKWETPSTPNILAIFLLARVLEDLLRKGEQALYQEMIMKKRLFEKFVQSKSSLDYFVKEAPHRSDTTMVLTSSLSPQTIIAHLKSKGLEVGQGYGEFKEKHIRISNFPANTLDHFEELIHALDQIV